MFLIIEIFSKTELNLYFMTKEWYDVYVLKDLQENMKFYILL